MLKFLTRKLRTHSLNEEDVSQVPDSGPDSEEEAPTPAESEMTTREDVVISPADTTCSPSSRSGSTSTTDSPYFMMTGTDLQYDQHSSEEELEVINNTPKETFRKYAAGADVLTGASYARLARSASRGGRALRPASAAPPEKRKWSQTQTPAQCPADPDRLASPFTANLSVAENDENAASNSAGGGSSSAGRAPPGNAEPHSSDEETLRSPDALPAPVRFRTSPPLEALKPRRAEGARAHRGLPPLAALGGRACSCCAPPHAPSHAHRHSDHLFHYEVSPRKRSRHSSRKHIQRPCLDFDKMQQLKVRAVTTWRHGGTEHGGELSVFCW